jgi:RNA polymerase sigma-70 factor (ECF subfamily)
VGEAGAGPIPLDRARIDAALAGDEPATRDLVRVLTPVIQARVARVLVRSGGAARGSAIQHDVQDATQEVLESLFARDGRTLRGWDANVLSLTSFVGMVAERDALSIVRSRRRNPMTESPTESEVLERATPPTDVEQTVLTRDLVRALFTRLERALSPLGMRVFRALFVDDQDVETASRELELTPDAIYQWRSRIRQTARAVADEIDPQPSSSPEPAEKAE